MKDIIINQHTNQYKKQYKYIAGVDEVGRGPLAGDVIAAAVILPVEYNIEYLTDSKKLTEKRREKAYHQIKQQAASFALGRCSPQEIDELNILQASLLAMKKAINNLSIRPDLVLIDGNFIPKELGIPAKAIIKGDLLEDVISAAAILAKVTRDTEMVALDQQYPGYGFAKHKGYPTKAHLEAIENQGVSEIHRKSFAPVRKLQYMI